MRRSNDEIFKDIWDKYQVSVLRDRKDKVWLLWTKTSKSFTYVKFARDLEKEAKKLAVKAMLPT